MGSKKGGFPVSVESRARGKTVTVIHNVSGNVEALLADLKSSVGSGGLVREGNVEVRYSSSMFIDDN
jgi:translation initiation factor 1 (eIF-1/SUI1)